MSIGTKKTFWKLIDSPEIERIEIPQIQRDYVQGRNTPRVEYAREKLLTEIKNSLSSNDFLDLNFVYGKDDNKVFIPIDGQQRLTTLLTLHIYAFAKDKKCSELCKLKQKFRYLTRTSTERFLEELVDHITDYFEQSEFSIDAFIRDSAWYSTEWDKDPSVESFIVVLHDLDMIFSSEYNLSDRLTADDCPITFMSLTISDVGLVNDLYIKMNSRGKALTEFETFKSELFDFLDNCESNADFKKKADNEWPSMIWDLCAVPEKECDGIYISFIHRIIMNRLLAGRYGSSESRSWKNLRKNNGFYNFADYKSYLTDGKAVNDVYYTFELCRWLIKEGLGDKAKQLIVDSSKLSHSDQVQVVALTKYAISVPIASWSSERWIEWNRIVNNLIQNTEIDREERFISAANSLFAMNSFASENANQFFAEISPDKIDFFSRTQIAEESFKCCLINLDKNWLDILSEAENDPYFEGEIKFALTLSGITTTEKDMIQAEKQKIFIENWKTIKLIFDATIPTKLCVEESLFRRGLLTYGDYSIWANSTHTLFFEGGKGYFNWRRMLRENNTLQIFSRFFYDLRSHNVICKKDVEQFLKELIDNYEDKTDKFRYYLIKIPRALNYMREKRFRRPEEDAYHHRSILYSGARLSADYSEAFTYFLYCQLPGSNNAYHYGKGYLDSETTFAYIEKINGKSVHITYDYSQNRFCDENNEAFAEDVDEACNFLLNNLV